MFRVIIPVGTEAAMSRSKLVLTIASLSGYEHLDDFIVSRLTHNVYTCQDKWHLFRTQPLWGGGFVSVSRAWHFF